MEELVVFCLKLFFIATHSKKYNLYRDPIRSICSCKCMFMDGWIEQETWGTRNERRIYY